MGAGLPLLFWTIQNNLLHEECVMFFNGLTLLLGDLCWSHHWCCGRWHPRTCRESCPCSESHLWGSSCHYHNWGNWGMILYPWGFSRHEYWSWLPCPPPGDPPNPGLEHSGEWIPPIFEFKLNHMESWFFLLVHVYSGSPPCFYLLPTEESNFIDIYKIYVQ